MKTTHRTETSPTTIVVAKVLTDRKTLTLIGNNIESYLI